MPALSRYTPSIASPGFLPASFARTLLLAAVLLGAALLGLAIARPLMSPTAAPYVSNVSSAVETIPVVADEAAVSAEEMVAPELIAEVGESLPPVINRTEPAAPTDVSAVNEVAPVPAAPLVEPARTENVVLVEPEGWDADSRRNITEALALLPAGLRAELGNPALGPLLIQVNDAGRTLSGRQPYGQAANFYSTNEGRNEVVLYPGQSARTALHELGHAFNLRGVAPGAYAQVFLQPEMQSFMAAAGWRVLTPVEALRDLRDHAAVSLAYDGPSIWTSLSRNDPLEDFANSFAAYFAAPEELKQLSPPRYAWFAQRFANP
jgi:hypothetical protein